MPKAGYNRAMSEEIFPIDGSEPGDAVYPEVSALKQGPDAPAATFNAELQALLDNTPRLPVDPESQKIEELRSGLLEYQRAHTKATVPTHTLLDDRKIVDVVLPRAEAVKEIKYKTLEEAVLAQIKNGEMSKLDIDEQIFKQRKNIESGDIVNRISVVRALDALVEKKLLQKNQNGTYSRPLKTIMGGSDLSDKIKEEPIRSPNLDAPAEPVSKLNSVKKILANGAVKVEDWLNKDREGIDPSGEGFLGGSKLNIPSEPSSSLGNKEGNKIEEPTLESRIKRLDNISEHDQLLSVIRTTLANTKSQSGEQGVTLEEYISQVNRAPMTKENIEKIGHIFEEISVMDGALVVHRTDGTPALVVGKPKVPEQKKPLGNIPQYTEVANIREQFLTEAGYTEFIKHIKQYIKDRAVISPMSLLNDLGEDGYSTTNPLVFLPYLEQLEKEGFLKRIVSTDEYPIFQRVDVWRYNNDLKDYLHILENKEGKIPLSIKMLQHDLKYSPTKEEALNFLSQARNSEYLTDKEVEEIKKIAFAEISLPDPLEVIDGSVYEKEEKKIKQTPVVEAVEPPPVVEQAEILPPPIVEPDILPPPVVEQEILPPPIVEPELTVPEAVLPTPVEDPAARVKDLNKGLGATGLEVKTSKEESLVFGPMTKEQAEMDEELREKVADARKVFAELEVEYKKEVWDAKGKYEKIMASLGASGKQRQLPDTSPEYREAQAAYMEAKWNLKNFIANRDVKEVPFNYSNSLIGPELGATRVIDVGALEQAEKEYRLFRNEITKLTPEKQKNIITKSLEGWTKLSLPKRYAISLAFLTVGGYALGSMTVGALVGAAAQRTVRTLGGTALAMGAGTKFDGIKRKEIKKAQEERRDEYNVQAETTKEEFVKKEAALKEAYEEEERVAKRNQFKKMGIMAAVAGVSNVGIGMGMNALTGAPVPAGVKVNPEVETSKPTVTPQKPSVMDKLLRQVPEKTVEAPASKIYVDPVKVDLSSKGFIDTVRGLKEQLVGKPMSPKLAELMTQKPEKIAMDLGLYKPGQAAESAFGLKGEYLAVDAEGEISLVHSDGTTIDKLFDGEKVNPYTGKMFGAELPVPAGAVEVPVVPKVAEVVPQTPKPAVEVTPKAPAVEALEIKSSVSRGAAAADAAVTTPAFVEVKPRLPIDFDQTVVKSPEYTGPQDMVFGKMPLKPEFQFDPKYKPERTAYNIQLEKALMSTAPDMFDLRFPIEYNGGRINVFWKASEIKGSNIKIFLNGQLIGTGDIIDGQPGLQYERSLGTSLLGVKSDFEKAFEVAQQGIMKNKMFFKKP